MCVTNAHFYDFFFFFTILHNILQMYQPKTDMQIIISLLLSLSKQIVKCFHILRVNKFLNNRLTFA